MTKSKIDMCITIYANNREPTTSKKHPITDKLPL